MTRIWPSVCELFAIDQSDTAGRGQTLPIPVAWPSYTRETAETKHKYEHARWGIRRDEGPAGSLGEAGGLTNPMRPACSSGLSRPSGALEVRTCDLRLYLSWVQNPSATAALPGCARRCTNSGPIQFRHRPRTATRGPRRRVRHLDDNREPIHADGGTHFPDRVYQQAGNGGSISWRTLESFMRECWAGTSPPELHDWTRSGLYGPFAQLLEVIRPIVVL
ncbi:hypothetical protein VTK73DRAFT_8572 [Phialemonium thermophilum]|uniref:Uncharacterized protein n=1 Tax=Phialemonium thermophilum TaxID=223376 RepID=A0ABR3W7W8_9PEZI